MHVAPFRSLSFREALTFPGISGRHGSFQKSDWSKKGNEYEAKRQNEPDEGSPEEEKRQEEPEKIERREEVSLAGVAPSHPCMSQRS
jgi:hypothetical protein